MSLPIFKFFLQEVGGSLTVLGFSKAENEGQDHCTRAVKNDREIKERDKDASQPK